MLHYTCSKANSTQHVLQIIYVSHRHCPFPKSIVYKLNLAVIAAGNGILDEGLQSNYKPLFVSL
jgi:hypothetical protein